MRMLAKIADKAATALVGEVRAGACVSGVGERCYCSGKTQYVYACKGNCVQSGTC